MPRSLAGAIVTTVDRTKAMPVPVPTATSVSMSSPRYRRPFQVLT